MCHHIIKHCHRVIHVVNFVIADILIVTNYFDIWDVNITIVISVMQTVTIIIMRTYIGIISRSFCKTFHSTYSDYDALRAHFQAKHFLCEDEACVDEKFTSVFRTEIDLRGKLIHWLYETDVLKCLYYSPYCEHAW